MAGINRALKHVFDSVALESYAQNQNKPCIFLSHISVDKDAVREIGKYIRENGDVDIYLDENDRELQDAARLGNPYRVTEFIEKGLSYSTHIMCLVSENTSSSWWVPYEIGFAKKSGKDIASLMLKGAYLPDFLKICKILEGTKSLNNYIENIGREYRLKRGFKVIHESLIQPSTPKHPLDDYLDWQK